MPTPTAASFTSPHPTSVASAGLRVSPGWVTAACDGSARPNPGPGGWAFVLAAGGWVSGGEARSTNNRMELTALLRLLEHVDPAADLEVRVDSTLVRDSVTKWRHGWARRGWRKADGAPVANADLVQAIHELLERRPGQLRLVWVKAHQRRGGDLLNEAADRRAQAASARAGSGNTDVARGAGW